MEDLQKKAITLGATEFGKSKRKDKKYYVVYQDKKINFGSATGKTFLDHGDEKKKANWNARHSKIKDKQGIPFYTKKTSAEFWSTHLQWS